MAVIGEHIYEGSIAGNIQVIARTAGRREADIGKCPKY